MADDRPLDAEHLYQQVWRFDFSAPGFCRVDLGTGIDSSTLRRRMLAVQHELAAVNRRRNGQGFAFRSLARFDQQVTTRFHVDGGPEQSLLLLGYEPSAVRSRLFLADYTRAAFDRGLTPRQFLEDFNPMYRPGEEELSPYATELPPAEPGHAYLLLVNNSSLPFAEDRANSLGVMHKAEVPEPDETAGRVVNSAMLVVGDVDEVTADQQQAFAKTDRVSDQTY